MLFEQEDNVRTDNLRQKNVGLHFLKLQPKM
jgi:hypothetical protein